MDSTWPFFKDFTDDGALDANVATLAETGGVKFGTYQCVRQMKTAAFPQNVAADGVITTVTATPVTQTFYGHDTNTLVGTSGQSTACCDLIKEDTCKQVVKVADKTDLGRIAFQGTTDKSTSLTSSTYAAYPLANGRTDWHMDYVLASSWQLSTVCKGTQTNALTAKVDLAPVGLTAGFKCTYRLDVAKDKGAPGFKLGTTTFVAFNLQWIEWEAASLTQIVPKVDATPFFLGTYAASWPMPIKYRKLGANTLSSTYQVTWTDQPNTMSARSYGQTPGPMVWYPTNGGVFDSEGTPIFYNDIKA
jgi:hypothetical protein